jgi:putative SOS response-associated peptidase YedK
MCGRYVLASDRESYASPLGARPVGEPLPPSWNVAPTHSVYVAAGWQGEVLLGAMRWGIPRRSARGVIINVRCETALVKFRGSMLGRRCLLPADGFYEWSDGRAWFLHTPDRSPVMFAGIWSPDTEGRTCAILTGPADGSVSRVHDRMPLVLQPADWALWLDPEARDPEMVDALLHRSYDPGWMLSEADPAVGRVSNNHPGLVPPLRGPQGSG